MTDIEKQETREIPQLPGGGTWRFDNEAWEWKSNDEAPAPAAAVPETPAVEQE